MSAADRYVPADLDVHEHIMSERCPRCDAEAEPLAEVSLELLALTADYPIGHPLRQAVGHYVARLALAEGKIQTATEVLDRGTSVGDEWDAAGAATDALEILRR